MRRLTISLIFAVFAIFSMSAQDLDKILNDHFKASGQELMSKITSVTIKGKISSMGMDMGVTIYQSRPGKLRVEADFAGSTMIQTYDGTTGWVYAPAMGIAEPQQMDSNQLKAVLTQAEMDSPLWNAEAKGNKIELIGVSEDGSAHMLKLITGEDDEMTIYISKETSLISKLNMVQMAGGMENEIETEMKDYKKVKGIQMAHYFTSEMSGQLVSTITFESIEFNEKLDSSLFGKPAVE